MTGVVSNGNRFFKTANRYCIITNLDLCGGTRSDGIPAPFRIGYSRSCLHIIQFKRSLTGIYNFKIVINRLTPVQSFQIRGWFLFVETHLPRNRPLCTAVLKPATRININTAFRILLLLGRSNFGKDGTYTRWFTIHYNNF